MATDLKAPRHELFVDQQLERVSKRLHVLDLGLIGLLLLALMMTDALVMALIDLGFGPRTSGWVPVLRYVVWGLWFAGSLFLGIVFCMRLYARINPYYAAKQIEETIPDAKNSVVNWIDLREKGLPTAVKTAIGLRAARDLKTTDPDESIHARKNTWTLVAVVSGLLFGLLILLAREPGRFVSLMQRAFVPMSDLTLAKKTRITLLSPVQPKEGPLPIEPKTKVNFQTKIGGEVPRINTPQAARLLFRYDDEDAWIPVPMEQDGEGIWNANLLPDQVRLGFTYKIAAGDEETKAFRVEVQSVTEARYEVTYRYQPYLHKPNRTVQFPNEVPPAIKEVIGTEVTFVVRTNRELHNGSLELSLPSGVRQLEGEVLANDRHAFRVKFMLETSGKFRVHFVTTAGKISDDTNDFDLKATADDKPVVELRKPGKEITLPANGTLQMEGFVSDDYGIKQVILRMEARQPRNGFDRIPLEGKVYRPGATFQFKDGSFADYLDYQDFVVLSELKDKDLGGKSLKLAKGDILDYWLEATDHCDYPRPNEREPGRSAFFRVVIGDSEDAAKEKEQKNQAQKAQEKHQKRQGEDLKQQERERQKKQQAQQQPGENTNDDQQARADEQKKIDDFVQKQIEKRNQEQGKQGNGQKQELTGQDVKDLSDLAKKDGPAGEMARNALKEAAENKAGNKDVRDQAAEALKNLPKQPEPKTTPEDVKNLSDLMKKDKGRLGQAAAEQLDKAGKESTDPDVKKAANDALKDFKPEQTNPGQKKDLSPEEFKHLSEMLKKDGALKDLAEKELKKAAEQKENKEMSKAAQDALQNQPQKKMTPEEVEQMSKLLKDPGPIGQMARQQLEQQAAKSSDKATRDAAKEAIDKNPPKPPEQKKEFSKEDIAAMNKALEDKGPLGDFARQQLKNAMDSARDEAVKKSAEESLKKQNEPTAKDIEELKKLADDPGPLGQAIREQMKNIAKEANDKSVREAAERIAQKTPPPADKKPEATEKDVAELQKLLDKPGAQSDFARKELQKIAEKADKEEVRAAAKEALQKAQDTSAEKATAADVEKLKNLAGGKGPISEDAKKALKNIAEHAKNDDAKKAAGEAFQKMRDPADAALDNALQKADPTKNITMNNVKEFSDLAKKKGLLGDIGKSGLEEAKRLAKDPDVKKAATEALEKLDQQKKEEPNVGDVANLKGKVEFEKGRPAEAARRELEWLAKNAQDKDVRDAAGKALKELPPPQAKHDRIKDATVKDVKKLEKDINKEGLIGEQAFQDLSEISRGADKEDVRKEAMEALKKRDPLKQQAASPEDIKKLQQQFRDETGPAADSAAREMFRLEKNSLNPRVRETALEAIKEEKIDPQTMKRDEHGGSLSLEAFLRSIPRNVLEANGINYEDYQRRLDAIKEENNLRGDTGLSGNTAPARAEPSGNSSTSQGNLGGAPPGFNDPFIRWTTGRNPDRK